IFLANIHLSNSTTDIVLGFTLSLIGCSLALKEFIKTKGERSLRKLTSYALLFLGGSISGLAVAFTSVGGGVITYIAVALAFPKLDTKSVIAIDATAGLMLSILASIEVISTGRGDAAVMVIIAAGGLLGCIGGEKIKGKVSSHLIKEAIAITVSFIGLIYLFRSHQFIAAATLGLLYLLALGLKKRSASKNHPASVESVQLTPIGALEN
nr:sulfite exporter TauE/SafE family protein [Actinomycetota bacterium]